METVSVPMQWSDFPDEVAQMFRGFRSPEGEAIVLQDNIFIEGVVPATVLRALSDEEMDHYRGPFRYPGEDRRPTLSWPRDVPLAGEPADVVAVVEEFGRWLAEKRCAHIVRSRRSRSHPAGGSRAQHRAKLAEPGRDRRSRRALPAGGQSGRDRESHRLFRAHAAPLSRRGMAGHPGAVTSGVPGLPQGRAGAVVSGAPGCCCCSPGAPGSSPGGNGRSCCARGPIGNSSGGWGGAPRWIIIESGPRPSP